MKYIAADINAVKEIISSRKLQSSEYEEGVSLSNTLKSGDDFEIKGQIKSITSEHGIFLITPNKDENRLLVFDTTSFSGFNKNSQEIIAIIQKTCRLALKLWSKIGFSPCERIIQGTNYVALIPLQFLPGKSYKIILDKRPDAKRQERRGKEHFLVFADGSGMSDLSPSMASFRDAEKDYLKVNNESIFVTDEPEVEEGFIKISDAPKSKESNISPFMGMKFWKENLTDSQKDFVFSERLGPDILKGAAGTGKTLSLALRCVHQLSQHKDRSQIIKSVFFTHSIATKNHIETLIASNGGEEFLEKSSPQHVTVTTLQEWCIENLGAKISATEYLDKDALESKNLQLLYIIESFEEFLSSEFESSKQFISKPLTDFFQNNDPWTIAVYLQNEISTYIKGRASEDFDIFKKLDRGKNSIPLSSDEDFSTIFFIFNIYQEKLVNLNLFDSDDITISALQETSTPIWKRRRIKEGYDVLYIDETHLFNVNELSLFHNLLKHDNTNIVFTIDRSQAVGDSSITASEVTYAIRTSGKTQIDHGFQTVFRCSSEIINLGSCVLASGATLFSHLENPLSGVNGGFIEEEENKCKTPYLVEESGEENCIRRAFSEAEELAKNLQVSKSKILIIPCDDKMLELMTVHCTESKISFNTIQKRGDYSTVKKAENEDSFLIGGIDYIGGLEFPAVVIAGIDKDRFPPKMSTNGESSHYLKYSAFNRLYVAITRAKFTVAFINDKSKGVSETINAALSEGLISR